MWLIYASRIMKAVADYGRRRATEQAEMEESFNSPYSMKPWVPMPPPEGLANSQLTDFQSIALDNAGEIST